jgi:CheY-like chemotaxis protein
MVNKRILVVEDNPINVIVLKKFIENYYELDAATNGQKAIEMIEKNNYALVLMDINLGGEQMNGAEVLRKVRENEHFNHLPFIAVTAYVTEEAIQKFKEDGFADVVSKPIDRERILNTINKYIAV